MFWLRIFCSLEEEWHRSAELKGERFLRVTRALNWLLDSGKVRDSETAPFMNQRALQACAELDRTH